MWLLPSPVVQALGRQVASDRDMGALGQDPYVLHLDHGAGCGLNYAEHSPVRRILDNPRRLVLVYNV